MYTYTQTHTYTHRMKRARARRDRGRITVKVPALLYAGIPDFFPTRGPACMQGSRAFSIDHLPPRESAGANYASAAA